MKNFLGFLAVIGLIMLPGLVELLPFWVIVIFDLVGLFFAVLFVQALLRAGDHDGR